jgi:hypothetical protein
MPLRWQAIQGRIRPRGFRGRRNNARPAHLSFAKGRRFEMVSAVRRPVALVIVEDESLEARPDMLNGLHLGLRIRRSCRERRHIRLCEVNGKRR